MKRIVKKIALWLSTKLVEIVDTRDELYRENLELKERIKNLESSEDIPLADVVIKLENCFQHSYASSDFSVKVFDAKTIPGKN